MQTHDEVLQTVKRIFSELFEIDEAAITPDASLYDDLDIDSIDAVDLMVKLKELTGKKIQPEEFKNVRTVDDVVNTVTRLVDA